MNGFTQKFLAPLLVIAVAAICMAEPAHPATNAARSPAASRHSGCSHTLPAPERGPAAPEPTHSACCQSGHPAAVLPAAQFAAYATGTAQYDPASPKPHRADRLSGLSRFIPAAEPPGLPPLRV